MILVTGGAGFIGANFVLGWLAQSDEAVINAGPHKQWSVA
jgi:dTDP-glucose 4,6-dehydratase